MDTIGVVGGTGPQGKGLGLRFARAGHAVTLGSRSKERARDAATELNAWLPGKESVSGTTNAEAVSGADIALLAVPYESHKDLVIALRGELAGRLVVSCVNPLGFDQRGPYGLDVPEGSAAEQAASLLPHSRIVAAFHHLSAQHLLGEKAYLDHEDVLVVSDDPEAKRRVRELCKPITGRPGIDAGALRLAGQLEKFIAVIISINKGYKVSSGMAISGLPETGQGADA